MPDNVSTSRIKLWRLSGVAVAAALVALLGWRLFGRTETAVYSRTAVGRGDIVKTISATGKLQAVVTVQVGSQVSGRIAEIYADFNSRVKNGQIIAKLDSSLLEAQLEQARSNLASAQARIQTAETGVANAEANVASAAANREKLRAAQQDASRAYRRTSELVSAGAAATRDVESAQAALAQADAQERQADAQIDQAKAQLLSARSQVNEARAEAKQTEASVKLASANLGYSIIRAPIDGVVIARNVDVGQTVAASFQAPTLFLIANDLTQMQVLADIDEADVGQLAKDSKVVFTVDAYPRDSFHGTVSEIRLNPQTVQNVVTYTAVIDVQNPEMKLKPGMTANVTAIVAERRDVLKVPNAALRFRPDTSGTDGKGSVHADAGGPRGAGTHTVWKIEGKDLLHPIPVKLGITDGVETEVLSGGLKPGDELATGQDSGKAAATATAVRNPMMPLGGRGGRR